MRHLARSVYEATLYCGGVVVLLKARQSASGRGSGGGDGGGSV